MKILIIGGTRFFGYFIAKRLVDDGHQVTLFNRGRTPDDFGDRVRRIKGDRNDFSNFLEKLARQEFDVVVDMIAFKAEDSQTAVEAFAGNVGHFIHISTGSVYIVTKDFPCPLREEDFDRPLYPPPEEDDEWWNYGYHKRKCEEVLREAFEKHGFPATMLRLPIVIGERDNTLRAYSYFIRILDGKPIILPDSGLNVFTHIYQDDIVRTVAMNLMNESSFGQAYNLAQAEILTLRAFILKAAEALNKKVELVDIPSVVLERAGLGTVFSPFFTRRPFVLDTQKARRDLNFLSTPFEIWIRKTVNWSVKDYKGGTPDNYRMRAREIEIVEDYKKAVKGMFIPLPRNK